MLMLVQKHGFINELSASFWPKRLGHIFKERIQRLVKNEILNDLDFTDLGICVNCIKGNKQDTHLRKQPQETYNSLRDF